MVATEKIGGAYAYIRTKHNVSMFKAVARRVYVDNDSDITAGERRMTGKE